MKEKESNGIWSHFWELQLHWREKKFLSFWVLEFGLQQVAVATAIIAATIDTG